MGRSPVSFTGILNRRTLPRGAKSGSVSRLNPKELISIGYTGPAHSLSGCEIRTLAKICMAKLLTGIFDTPYRAPKNTNQLEHQLGFAILQVLLTCPERCLIFTTLIFLY